jgi:hypothetical protein
VHAIILLDLLFDGFCWIACQRSALFGAMIDLIFFFIILG